jgi:hypothetical protein
MIYRDPKCVYVGKDGATANMMAGLLEGAGFPSQVMNEATLGGFEGVTGWVPGFSHKGVEVWVLDPVHIEPAKKFLDDEMESVQALKEKRAARSGSVTTVCEECGNSSEWPAREMGTTKQCPHCAAHMDVPDPDDDWDDLDVGVPEDDDSPA